ncbi:MAG: hypothetical protein ACREMY_06095, partial [bacterium]
MHLRKRGPVFVVDFLDADGKRRRVSTGERERPEAARRAREIVGDTQRCGRVTVTLHDALERVWRERWQHSKSAVTLRYVVPAIQRDELGALPVSHVSYERMKAYGERLSAAGKFPATMNRRMSAISAALTECARRGELAALPLVPHWQENNTRDRYLSAEEESRALAYVRRMQADDCAE